VTHYRVPEQYVGVAWVECRLETGRTHQIRVHLAHIGHPLLGDPVYTTRRKGPVKFSRQALHAFRLGLVHPATGEGMEWEAPLPEDLGSLLAQLERRDAS
jgi:23S rRNA pseudouridine1911/1915/1917 synthase